MELTPAQIIIIGLVASILAQVIKMIAAKYGQKFFTKAVVSWIVMGFSLVLSVLWLGPKFPPIDDPANFLLVLFQVLTQTAGFAVLIYNVLLARVLEKIGFDPQRFLPK